MVQRLLLCVGLLVAVCQGLPTETYSAEKARELGIKPMVAMAAKEAVVVTEAATAAAPAQDNEYELLTSAWTEPKTTYEPAKPQTGSLLSLEEQQGPVDLDAPKESTSTPAKKTIAVKEISMVVPKTPNPVEYHIPVVDDHATSDRAGSNESVAAVPIPDPAKKDLAGVYPPPIVFDRPEFTHPMEILTPLVDPEPCDPARILQVSVPAATFDKSITVPSLPAKYGCSDWNDVSREKASPAITWSNVYEDVIDFSVQMIDIGEGCSGKGPTVGRIHWHIEGIKKAASVSLQEGASRDSRLLRGGKEEPNQWMEEYYAGPCPEPGASSCYRIKVLAHRANGVCQCGFQDVLFSRPGRPEDLPLIPWTYQNSTSSLPPPSSKQ